MRSCHPGLSRIQVLRMRACFENHSVFDYSYSYSFLQSLVSSSSSSSSSFFLLLLLIIHILVCVLSYFSLSLSGAAPPPPPFASSMFHVSGGSEKSCVVTRFWFVIACSQRELLDSVFFFFFVRSNNISLALDRVCCQHCLASAYKIDSQHHCQRTPFVDSCCLITIVQRFELATALAPANINIHIWYFLTSLQYNIKNYINIFIRL